MGTIRAKFALLLLGSIVAVVALITLAVIYLFALPKESEVSLLARQLITMKRLSEQDPTPPIRAPQPDAGPPDREQTELMRAAVAALGVPLDLTVTRRSDDRRFRTVSLPVGPGSWVLMEIDPPADPHFWLWLAFITVGVGSVAVFAAHRMSRPLALLESALAQVGPDGILPALAERGPAEVRATAAAINSLSVRLKSAMESRMRLVAAAGHDLRTPLTRMRLRAEFVPDEEERSLWLRDIDELQRIAHSAIQLVHEETTKTSLEIIRLDQKVRRVVVDLQQQGYAIDMAELCEVEVSASRLSLNRALRNLLINAATHGVRGTVAVAGGVRARVTITDQGPGIEADILDQVFEPFFRADRARSQSIPGAGLGLTISREIIRKAGGDITIANRPGGGLVQVIELPALISRSPSS
ncbi:ATP-binding protein [Ancylobacter sp.]|uniref:ATP-binding protein n=1 Tax=Ancylobacter sp. TaxID=1872567 RepID=UPI003D1486B4